MWSGGDGKVIHILQWIVFFAIIIIIYKLYEYFQDKKYQKQRLEEDVRRQSLEIARLKGTINGQCPSCGKEKTEVFICSCGFAYVDGNYCFSCGKYYPYSQLKKGLTMQYLQDPTIYECKGCEGKVFKPVDRSI